MARDERRRQRALLRKKRRREEKRAELAGLGVSGPPLQGLRSTSEVKARKLLVRSARSFPIFECLVRNDVDAQGLSPFLITRMQPNGNLVFAAFLVDLYCLGVKNAFANAEIPRPEYELRIKPGYFVGAEPRVFEPVLFHQMLYGAIDYAASLGFEPHSDFEFASSVLEPRSSVPPNPDLRFGKDGKPFYINGPKDNVAWILRTLQRNVGEGNFHYLVFTGPEPC